MNLYSLSGCLFLSRIFSYSLFSIPLVSHRLQACVFIDSIEFALSSRVSFPFQSSSKCFREFKNSWIICAFSWKFHLWINIEWLSSIKWGSNFKTDLQLFFHMRGFYTKKFPSTKSEWCTTTTWGLRLCGMYHPKLLPPFFKIRPLSGAIYVQGVH